MVFIGGSKWRRRKLLVRSVPCFSASSDMSGVVKNDLSARVQNVEADVSVPAVEPSSSSSATSSTSSTSVSSSSPSGEEAGSEDSGSGGDTGHLSPPLQNSDDQLEQAKPERPKRTNRKRKTTHEEDSMTTADSMGQACDHGSDDSSSDTRLR